MIETQLINELVNGKFDTFKTKIYHSDHSLLAILTIKSTSKSKVEVIDTEDAKLNQEARIQLIEASTYDFMVVFETEMNDYVIDTEYSEGIVTQNQLNPPGNKTLIGKIKTRNYTGTVPIAVYALQKNKPREIISDIFWIEIRSSKIDYRKHYQIMLNEIIEYSSDLIYDLPSSTYHKLSSSDDEFSNLFIKFQLLKTILADPQFEEALNIIIFKPKSKLVDNIELIQIGKTKRLSRNELKQIVSRRSRMKLGHNHPLNHIMSTLPTKIEVINRKETTNIKENQYVKSMLISYTDTLYEIRDIIYGKSKKEQKYKILYDQVLTYIDFLESFLQNELFRGINPLYRNIQINTVIQQKNGYREMYQTWLKYQVSGILTWKGGEEIFNAGKKDIATLYEYWVFFKLFEIIDKNFTMPNDSISEFIKLSSNGITLVLEKNNSIKIDGFKFHDEIKINIRFQYNRIFKRINVIDPDFIPDASWTNRMDPDYTLSFWLGKTDYETVIKTNKIKHLHFDAKYKINNLKELIENNDYDKGRKSKSVDIIKMHAYRDAIQRSEGSYIIFPGSEELKFKKFYTILPGLGAFPLLPNDSNKNSKILEKFIIEAMNHIIVNN